MADADKQKEPSIEDILSSIRQAVSSEEEGEQRRGKDSTGSGELNDDAALKSNENYRRKKFFLLSVALSLLRKRVGEPRGKPASYQGSRAWILARLTLTMIPPHRRQE